MPASASGLRSRENSEDPSYREQTFINGAFVDAASGATFDRVGPAGGHNRSRFGRDKPLYAMETCTELENTWFHLS